MLARTLLCFIGAPAGLFARLARRCRTHLHGIARDLPAARGFRDAHKMIGGLVYRLQVALVLELLARRRDIRVPTLGHPAAGELDIALVKRRDELKEEEVLLDVQNGYGHDPTTLAT